MDTTSNVLRATHRILKLWDSAIDLLRNKHKNGESYYWLLYYSYLSPQQMRNYYRGTTYFMRVKREEYARLRTNRIGKLMTYIREFPAWYLNPDFEKFEFSLREVDWEKGIGKGV